MWRIIGKGSPNNNLKKNAYGKDEISCDYIHQPLQITSNAYSMLGLGHLFRTSQQNQLIK